MSPSSFQYSIDKPISAASFYWRGLLQEEKERKKERERRRMKRERDRGSKRKRNKKDVEGEKREDFGVFSGVLAMFYRTSDDVRSKYANTL